MKLNFDTKFSGEIPRLKKPISQLKQVAGVRAYQLLRNKNKVRSLRVRNTLGDPSMIGISSQLSNDNVVLNQVSKLILKDF